MANRERDDKLSVETTRRNFLKTVGAGAAWVVDARSGTVTRLRVEAAGRRADSG